MDWNSNLITNLEWSSEITHISGKQKVADEIAAKVKDGAQGDRDYDPGIEFPCRPELHWQAPIMTTGIA